MKKNSIRKLKKRLSLLKKKYVNLKNFEVLRFNKQFVQLKKKYQNKINEKKNFNLFKILLIEGREISHSSFLAWLLNPLETHNLKSKFIHDFVKLTLNKNNNPHFISKINLTKSEVSTEKSGEESRIDIHLNIPYKNKRGKFIVVIENKIFSLEGDNQTLREHKDFNPDIFIYLTPYKDRIPLLKDCIVIDYWDIHKMILKIIKAKIVSKDIEFFLKQYLFNMEAEIMETKFEKFNEKSGMYLGNYEMIKEIQKSFEEQLKSFWEKMTQLIKGQKWFDNKKWEIHPANIYAQIYKKAWKSEKLFIHFEPFLDESYAKKNELVLCFHIEGKDIESRKVLLKRLKKFYKKLEKKGYTIQKNSDREPFYKIVKLNKEIFKVTLNELKVLVQIFERTIDSFVKGKK